MPTIYKVNAPGFFNGKYYSPHGKRRVLEVDKPFTKKNMPSWVSKMPETSGEPKWPTQAEESIVEEKSTHQQVQEASFLGEGEQAEKGSKIETI